MAALFLSPHLIFSLAFTKHQCKLMKGNDVTHNHPLSTPPSPEDLYLLVDNEANSFRTCGKNGTYVLEYSDKISNLPEFNIFENKYLEIQNKLLPSYADANGYITSEEELIKFGDAIWEELFKEYGVKPTFERS